MVCAAKRRDKSPDDDDLEALDNRLRKEIGDEKYDELVEAAAQVLMPAQAAIDIT